MMATQLDCGMAYAATIQGGSSLNLKCCLRVAPILISSLAINPDSGTPMSKLFVVSLVAKFTLATGFIVEAPLVPPLVVTPAAILLNYMKYNIF